MNWQPMDTAPKDGTRILCYFTHNIFQGETEEVDEEDRIAVCHWGGDYWEVTHDAEHYVFDMPLPTAWMPLPKAPS